MDTLWYVKILEAIPGVGGYSVWADGVVFGFLVLIHFKLRMMIFISEIRAQVDLTGRVKM